MLAVPERRQRLLKAMGVTPWRLRAGGAVAAAVDTPANDAPGEQVSCVVILPAGALADIFCLQPVNA